MPRRDLINRYWQETSSVDRWQFEFIYDWITPSSTVLDLGCGDGTLLARLKEGKLCKVVGVDISPLAIEKARSKGVEAYVHDLDEPLPFDDRSFDYVILCEVLEHLYDPIFALKEGLRVARRAMIISIPNYGYIKYRLYLLLKGRVPVIKGKMNWMNVFNNDHIRLFSFADFKEALKQLDINIRIGRIKSWPFNLWRNLLSNVIVMYLEII
jgi:methionine biosynthesis protein MetW